MKNLFILLAFLPATGIAQTTIGTNQIRDSAITRAKLNTTSTGKAVVTRLRPGTGVTMTYTGVDTGTGLVTISASGGGSGDVVGPSSATANAVAVYNSTTGKLIKNSTILSHSNNGITTGGYSSFPGFLNGGTMIAYNPSGDAGNGSGIGAIAKESSFAGMFVGFETSAPSKWLIGISNNASDRTALSFYEDASAGQTRMKLSTGGGVVFAGGGNGTANSLTVQDVNGNPRLSILDNGTTTISSLAGTGTRMVTASSSGVLGTSSSLNTADPGSGTSSVLLGRVLTGSDSKKYWEVQVDGTTVYIQCQTSLP